MAVKLPLLLLSVLCCLGPALTKEKVKECGQRVLVGPPGSRIMGSREAPRGAWPWQVSIQIQRRHHCGGTVIDNNWVLSASHCFQKYRRFTKRFFRVVAGIHGWSETGMEVQVRSIKKIELHKSYDLFTSDNDISLIYLDTPLKYNNFIQPACFPNDVAHELSLNFTQCYITGWGSKKFRGPIQQYLQEAEVNLINRDQCNHEEWYDGFVTTNMMCAGLEAGGVDACQGDSGGPLQCYSEIEDRFYVVGVTSFGEGCGLPRRPGIYSKTSVHADWLKSKVELSSASHMQHFGLIMGPLCAALMTL